MSQVVPTGPGWWWVERPGGERVCVGVLATPGGWLYIEVGDVPYEVGNEDPSSLGRWLAPVASVEEVEQLRAAVSAFVEQAQLRGGAK